MQKDFKIQLFLIRENIKTGDVIIIPVKDDYKLKRKKYGNYTYSISYGWF